MQGFNMGRYVPPEHEGISNGNVLNKKRAPGTLRKDGSQTVRFEMPYAVWCHTCQPHAIIGQGVRFNAIKQKVGSYFSTPIWQFSIKHAACGGTIVIKTDPKNTAYVITAGGKARDYGEASGSGSSDRVRDGYDGRPILTEEERARRREDAFAELEAKKEEVLQSADNATRIQELYRQRHKDWDDPWSANQRLRDASRHARKIRKRDEAATQSLKDRIGTDIDILPATDEDAQQASRITFGPAVAEQDHTFLTSATATTTRTTNSTGTTARRSASKGGSQSKAELQQKLIRSTRNTLDPFG